MNRLKTNIMLSKLHQQDIKSLSRSIKDDDLMEFVALQIGNRHGYKRSYIYLDTFIKPNKTRREKIKEQSYKLLTKTRNYAKSRFNSRERIYRIQFYNTKSISEQFRGLFKNIRGLKI